MKSTQITRSFLVVLVSLLTLTVSTTPVGAQTAPTKTYKFIVNIKADTHDAHPGDGKCAGAKGKCSLRAAIEEADALPQGSSITITLPKGMYTLTLGTLGLTANSITINGASSKTTIISGNNMFGVMAISANVPAHLSRLTIEGGKSGGNGGGIINGGTLSVSNSTLSGNTATGGNGGGISNESGGTLSVSNSTFSGNSAGYGGSGGGIENVYGGTMSVSNSTFSGNSAGYGGSGGGIENYYGPATVSNSTFSSNLAGYGGTGGGIDTYDGTVTVSNSTFSGNSAGYGSNGGGIDTYAGTVTVSNSTLSANSAGSGGSGGDISTYAGTVTLTGTIVANSTGGSNCAGKITEGVGYNVDSSTSCGFSLSTDLNNTDPKLGGLRNNGGPTQTMALLKGSKAIDWVAKTSCPATDQRGHTRPDNKSESTCDIGAYESAY